MDRGRRRKQLRKGTLLRALFAVVLLGCAWRVAGGLQAVVAEPVSARWVEPGQCTSTVAAALELVPVVVGLSRPLDLAAPPRDSRLFVAEQGGRIWVVEHGKVLPAPFADLSRRLTTANNEQGLLGMAFHPRYPSDPRVFVNYSERGTGATVIAVLRVDPEDSNRTLPDERRLLRVEQPYGNHNAGGLAFSPTDGHLYIGFGDGGAGGDPRGNGQNSATTLGSMLRMDVGPAGGEPIVERWATGLRNPWRFSFDPENSDLYIGDVGQNTTEEINWVSGKSSGGENYGWNVREGDRCYGVGSECPLEGRTDPVYTAKARLPCNSITGGHVYRGRCLPDLTGRYVFGDYCHDSVLSFTMKDGAAEDLSDLTQQLDPKGELLSGVASFGVDGFGELYVVSHRNGIVYRIAAAGSESE